MQPEDTEQIEVESIRLVEEPDAAVADVFIGTMLDDRYRVLSLIGSGATASVYKAEDTRLKRFVAVKVLHNHLLSDVEIVRRFEREARTATSISHPNVVTVYDSGTTPTKQPYMVMEYVEGKTLEDVLQQQQVLPLKRLVSIFTQVCAALAAAHEKGVIHRDLKPSNIMLVQKPDGEEHVEVVDFGIASVMPVQGDAFMKLTQTGAMLGTLLYMSPEQCLDQHLDGRADVYALGCVLYETVTGKPPINARTAFETMNKHLTDMPLRLKNVRPDLDWPPALERVIFKAMAKKPEDRYQSIVEMQNDLMALEGSEKTAKLAALIPQYVPPLPRPELDELLQDQSRNLLKERQELLQKLLFNEMQFRSKEPLVIFLCAALFGLYGIGGTIASGSPIPLVCLAIFSFVLLGTMLPLVMKRRRHLARLSEVVKSHAAPRKLLVKSVTPIRNGKDGAEARGAQLARGMGVGQESRV
jgi:serine/threonine protein kinase